MNLGDIVQPLGGKSIPVWDVNDMIPGSAAIYDHDGIAVLVEVRGELAIILAKNKLWSCYARALELASIDDR